MGAYSHINESKRILPVCLVISAILSFSCKPAHSQEGYASYYTVKSCQREGTSGVFTANGERYNEQALTCAVRSRRFGTSYLVYGHKTGRSVIVRHNDFGPGKGPTRKGVVVDLTPKAFGVVCGDLKQGKCQVSVQEVR
jgi:rare lipoprotein A